MPLLWPVGYVLGLLMGSDTGLRTERVFDSGLRSVQGVAFLLSPPPGSVWLCDTPECWGGSHLGFANCELEPNEKTKHQVV